MKALLIALALLATACQPPPQPTRLEQCRAAIADLTAAACAEQMKIEPANGIRSGDCNVSERLRAAGALQCLQGFR